LITRPLHTAAVSVKDVSMPAARHYVHRDVSNPFNLCTKLLCEWSLISCSQNE